MKKKICALLLTFMMMFAFSVSCFAALSPVQTAVPTKEAPDGNGGGGNGGGNNGKVDRSSTSPKTGMTVAGAFVAIVTASGVALVARRKFTEE